MPWVSFSNMAADRCWVLTVGAVVSTGLRRNTAAMLELRCCCRGLRYGSVRWTIEPACKRTASYGGARTDCVALPWAFRSTSAREELAGWAGEC